MIDLEAIELIKQLKARYFRFLDTANWEGMKASVFVDDATINFKSPSYDRLFEQISKRPDDVKVTAIPIGNRFACD